MSNTIPKFDGVEQLEKEINADFFSLKAEHGEIGEHGEVVEVVYGWREPVRESIPSCFCLDCGVEVQIDCFGVESLAVEFGEVGCDMPEVDVLDSPADWFDSLSPNADIGNKMRVYKESFEAEKTGAGWVVSLGDGDNHVIVADGGVPRCSCSFREFNDSCVHEYALYFNRLAETTEEPGVV